jgi:F-type H+-transporting ATPase subunit delta
MTGRAAARRYGVALFDVSLKETDPRKVEQDLGAFVALVGEHPELEQVLLNPVIPVARKRSVVATLASRMSLEPVVSKLLELLAARDRLGLVREVLEQYRERLLDHLEVVRAEVTTAVPLGEDRLAAIGQGLGALTGRQVVMTTRVEPEILGGVVARIGSTVYDGSLRRQLERIKEKLAGGA